MEDMKGDLDQTSNNPKYSAPIGPGMIYTLLSRAKSRDRIHLLNFKEDQIKVNQNAVEEMKRMREESKFSWNHPLKIPGKKICLFNIRSWNLHIKHFLSDKVYFTESCVFCFTETHTHRAFQSIENYQEGWNDIHKATDHGLAICYDTTKVQIVQQFSTTDVLQLLPVVIKIEDEQILLVLVYRHPGPMHTFIQSLIHQLSILPTDKYRVMIVGDFNMDQMLSENVEKLQPLLTRFNLHQRSEYSTHIHGGILDLVLDDKESESIEWMPSPYSDHFVILIQI